MKSKIGTGWSVGILGAGISIGSLSVGHPRAEDGNRVASATGTVLDMGVSY
jgi:hypothetical protein